VLAAGAIERPLVFPGNDRPGIMLAGAARTYVNRYGAVPGSRAVVITACDEAYRAALDLHEAGVFIAIIADIRAKADGPLAEAARHAGLPVQTATTIVGTSGRLRVDTVRLARVDDHGHVIDGEQIMPCDLVLMSGGFTPTVHLFSQSRGKLVWDEKTLSFVPGQAAERVRSAGACRGVYSLAAVLNDGSTAGAAAAAAARSNLAAGPVGGTTSATAPSDPPIGAFAGALPQPGGATGSMAFVDWQNDVTTKDLALATREGFRSVEHIKRYTTTGMATDQG
jgi:sarcosine oxidase subunit alpha